MAALQTTIDMFQQFDEISTIKQDFLLLFAEVQKGLRSSDKVRRGVYAEVKDLKKENSLLKEELNIIKKHLNLEINHEENLYGDLPIMQFIKRQ
jgi:hypothetical protein